MNNHVSILIVNFNTSKLLKRCIDSILSDQSKPEIEIIVIDNASADDSIEMLQNTFPDIHIITNDHNCGFAEANNQGLEKATGEFTLLLNPDTELFPGALRTLHNFLSSQPDAGACGPRTWLDNNKTLEVCSLKILTPERAHAVFTRLPSIKRQRLLSEIWKLDAGLWSATNPYQVEGIGGAAFFIRTDQLKSLGGLDQRFYLGYEDTDLCMALNYKGKKIFIVPDAEIVHLFGQSKQTTQAPKAEIYAWQTAPLQFIEKYFGKLRAKHLVMQKFIDSIWRKFKPDKPFGAEFPTQANGITLQWPVSETNGYVFEISNDFIFFDKFGKVTPEPFIHLSSELLNRLNTKRWFWRAWPFSTVASETPIKFGYWLQDK
ncbi:MAG: glycosyltransferase family 2 protein [bacterium]